MSYQLKPGARENWEPIPGVPWDGEPISDERFAEISDEYDKQFPESPGSLRAWFDHVGVDARDVEIQIRGKDNASVVLDELAQSKKTKGGER